MAINAYEVLRDIHHIGSPLVGTVIDRTEIDMSHGYTGGYATLATTSVFRAILPYENLADDRSGFNSDLIPKLGSQIETVVFNFVDETLYLSAKPNDLKSSTVAEWRDFYDYIGTLPIGSEISGVVVEAMPFGLFINIGSPYLGLIDIGHSLLNGGQPLPIENDKWPKVGCTIRCNISYFRFRNRQVGLGWIPDAVQNKVLHDSPRAARSNN